MTDLIVDPQIRTWVFLPIVIITFCAGLVRHYITLLLRGEKVLGVEQTRDFQTLQWMELLRMNGNYITEQAFEMRRCYIHKREEELTSKEKPPPFVTLMEDRSVLVETVLGNTVNFLPMLLIGSWLMFMLSGFILTKIPIPLTLRFKNMLQKDIHLVDLEAEWVSSASWYFLNVVGLRSIYHMFFGDQDYTSDEASQQSKMPVPPHPGAYFKGEIEAITIIKHACLIDNNLM